jgi:hypothetical protein
LVEKIIDLSPKSTRGKILPRGYQPFKRGMKVRIGDRIAVDLGGIEYATGKVTDPNAKDSWTGKKVIEFSRWLSNRWKVTESCLLSQIKGIKQK